MTVTPTNKRCDGYLASFDPIEKGRVLFFGTHRAVVVKEFKTLEEFQKERLGPSRPPREFRPGFVERQERPQKEVPILDASEPPAGAYYYGVAWLPEEYEDH